MSKRIQTATHCIVPLCEVQVQAKLICGERNQGGSCLGECGLTRKECRGTYEGLRIIFYPVSVSKLVEPNT